MSSQSVACWPCTLQVPGWMWCAVGLCASSVCSSVRSRSGLGGAQTSMHAHLHTDASPMLCVSLRRVSSLQLLQSRATRCATCPLQHPPQTRPPPPSCSTAACWPQRRLTARPMQRRPQRTPSRSCSSGLRLRVCTAWCPCPSSRTRCCMAAQRWVCCSCRTCAFWTRSLLTFRPDVVCSTGVNGGCKTGPILFLCDPVGQLVLTPTPAVPRRLRTPLLLSLEPSISVHTGRLTVRGRMGTVPSLRTHRGTFCTHRRRRELHRRAVWRRVKRVWRQHAGAVCARRQQQQLGTSQGRVIGQTGWQLHTCYSFCLSAFSVATVSCFIPYHLCAAHLMQLDACCLPSTCFCSCSGCSGHRVCQVVTACLCARVLVLQAPLLHVCMSMCVVCAHAQPLTACCVQRGVLGVVGSQHSGAGWLAVCVYACLTSDTAWLQQCCCCCVLLVECVWPASQSASQLPASALLLFGVVLQ